VGLRRFAFQTMSSRSASTQKSARDPISTIGAPPNFSDLVSTREWQPTSSAPVDGDQRTKCRPRFLGPEPGPLTLPKGFRAESFRGLLVARPQTGQGSPDAASKWALRRHSSSCDYRSVRFDQSAIIRGRPDTPFPYIFRTNMSLETRADLSD